MRFFILLFAGLFSASLACAQGLEMAQADPFKAWLAAVAKEAVANGVRPAIVDTALSGVTLNSSILKSSTSQPEKRETLSDYLGKRISINRVEKGRAFYQQHRTMLDDIAAKTGVPASIVVAIWGVETAYGSYTGGAPVIEALATLGYGSDRKPFFRKELLHALRILDEEHIDLANMTGSWAGAMGQPQFMPSSYLTYAADYDGDGKVDIWTNLGDVFFSIASYLKKHGWQAGAPWGAQATVSGTFRSNNPGAPDRSTKALACVSPYDKTCRTDSLRFWLGQGVIAPLSAPEGLAMKARVVMPDGALGPAYIAPKNFDVILTYNRSNFYAVSVGVLAQLIEGEAPESKQAVQ